MARAEFSPLAIGDAWPIAAAHGRGITALLEAALGEFPRTRSRKKSSPRARRAQSSAVGQEAKRIPGPERDARDQDRHHRPAQRRQVDPGQPHARRRAGHRLRSGRHHPRQHLHPLRARRCQVHPDRHRRRAPPRQDLRGGGKVLGGQDPAGDPGRQRGDLRHGRPRRRGRPRPQPARLRAGNRSRAGHRAEQVGRHGATTSATT